MNARARSSSRTPIRRRGRRWLSRDIEALAGATDALVLVDEAYADFADDNCLSLPGRQPNVLVTRTFSKGYGLAGLRFGYAIGDREVIAQMAKVKDSYNCDAIAIAAACAALDDRTTHAQLAGHSSTSASDSPRSWSDAVSRSSRARRISSW